MSPTFSSGANTDERVPTTTRASPFRTRHHSRARSTSLSAECKTATPSNRAPNHDRHCRSLHGATARQIRPIQTVLEFLSARAPAPHSMHEPEAYTPHRTDLPPDQSAPPNSRASRRAASARSPLGSPAPASRGAAEAAARAPSPAIPARVLLYASSARSASPRCLFPLLFPPLLFPPLFFPSISQ